MREMKFREGFVDGVDDYFGGSSTLFMTSKISQKPILNMMVADKESKLLKIYADFNGNIEHLNNSIDYLGLL